MTAAAGVLSKLAGHAELYGAVPSPGGGTSLTFSYLRAPPTVVATNAPSILVIGPPENYQLVFRDLSYSGFDTAHAIAVQGGPYVDDYSAQDLARFDEVLIYGGRAHQSAHAYDLMSGYVKAGGGLIFESSGSPWANGSGTQEPLPITGATRHDVKSDWRFKTASSPITDGIDFSSFDPPAYSGGAGAGSAAGCGLAWAAPSRAGGPSAVGVVRRARAEP